MYHRKDASLDELAGIGNVAQFVGFAPLPDGTVRQTYSRLAGWSPNHVFADVRQAVTELLAVAPDGTVNVRSYTPESPRSREFLYGLATVDEAAAAIERLGSDGLHLIVNETVDVADGGVSGVVQAGVVEFAPDDTPRCVEKPGVATLPLAMGLDMLEIVYGFRPALPTGDGRLEFSVHPRPRGWKQDRTLLWEYEDVPTSLGHAAVSWPNRFSRHLGDKLYGLLVAHLTGVPVPRTIAMPRRLAPFAFALPTGGDETWIRTCPTEPEPGLFTTHRGWLDPFGLMAREDPEGRRIASVLSQEGIRALHSGASVFDADGTIVVEGVAGGGDRFMLGEQPMEALPEHLIEEVRATMVTLRDHLGPVRIEWVHDGRRCWVVQLHVGAVVGASAILVPGEPDRWIDFHVSQGIDALRRRLEQIVPPDGLRLIGEVGVTSHIADLARKSGLPTRIHARGL